jgi:hypothetical protein
MRLDDDDFWGSLRGGRGEPYDPRPALTALEDGDAEDAWDELWDNLQHQGDIGLASYAAVPEIVRLIASAPSADGRAYGLLAVIEEGHLRGWPSSPAMPEWLKDDYQAAWRAVLGPALRDLATATSDDDVRTILAVLAFSKGQPRLGLIAMKSECEWREMLDGPR